MYAVVQTLPRLVLSQLAKNYVEIPVFLSPLSIRFSGEVGRVRGIRGKW